MRIERALGLAHFVGKDVVVEEAPYRGRNIVITTGSRLKELTIPGDDKIPYLTNQNIVDLRKLPKNLLIIGGGPIG